MSDWLVSLKKAALLAVVEPDASAFMRQIARWFSKTFHTPLPDVENLPKEYILEHYFEELFENMEKEELHNQIIYVLETPEERKARETKEREIEDEFMKELQEEAKMSPEEIKKKFVQDELNKKLKRFKKDSLKKKEEIPPPPSEEVSIQFSEDEIDLDSDFIPSKK